MDVQKTTNADDELLLRSEQKRILKTQKKRKLQLSSFDLPVWLVEVYMEVWMKHRLKSEDDTLANSTPVTREQATLMRPIQFEELLSMPIDPESPRWYFLDVQSADELRNCEVRRFCWQNMQQKLYVHLKNDVHQQNAFAFHNAAVLCFLIHELDEALKILHLQVDAVFHPALLCSLAYFYIQLRHVKQAAKILYHVLRKEKEPYWHAIYLSMRVLSHELQQKVEIQKIMQIKDHEQIASIHCRNQDTRGSLLSQFFLTGDQRDEGTQLEQQIEQLKRVRLVLMEQLCLYNPENTLYKLWNMNWHQDSAQSQQLPLLEEWTPRDCQQQAMSFLVTFLRSKKEEQNDKHLLQHGYELAIPSPTSRDSDNDPVEPPLEQISAHSSTPNLVVKIWNWVKPLVNMKNIFAVVFVTAASLGVRFMVHHFSSLLSVVLPSYNEANEQTELATAQMGLYSPPIAPVPWQQQMNNAAIVPTWARDPILVSSAKPVANYHRPFHFQATTDDPAASSVVLTEDNTTINPAVKDYDYVDSLFKEIQYWANKFIPNKIEKPVPKAKLKARQQPINNTQPLVIQLSGAQSQ